MKKEIDKEGRMLYISNHSITKGGNVYICKTLFGKIINNKQGLRNALNAISKKHNLVDPTIKIYNDIFFFFFHIPKLLVPAILIECINKNIAQFAEWDKEYIFTGVQDLQSKFLKEYLKTFGYDHEKG